MGLLKRQAWPASHCLGGRRWCMTIAAVHGQRTSDNESHAKGRKNSTHIPGALPKQMPSRIAHARVFDYIFTRFYSRPSACGAGISLHCIRAFSKKWGFMITNRVTTWRVSDQERSSSWGSGCPDILTGSKGNVPNDARQRMRAPLARRPRPCRLRRRPRRNA